MVDVRSITTARMGRGRPSDSVIADILEMSRHSSVRQELPLGFKILLHQHHLANFLIKNSLLSFIHMACFSVTLSSA
ncbi:hypothetical protein SESBI_47682 [Sesbania bispinosa]|nr:hypothetical protein SESBI_47682 [Sesbania bispinosa]